MIETEFVNGWQTVHQGLEKSTQDLKKMTFQMYAMRTESNSID